MHPTVIFIRTTLKDRGISYARLSELTGLDESKIKRVLSGRQAMSLDTRDKIFSSLGIADFKRTSTTLSQHELLHLWSIMPPSVKDAILSLMLAVASERK
ncbi:helix-turn-helix domain-containing protein [Vibrio navarrensis]|uniref:helix-turn-helix domain-containing protein n=1 Tax=Vibrio navarrensis TaxID=29495 RepID=UPI001869A70B|nr:helix-turn-helix transcriptional regulator [Vibrio navarrensis]